MLVFNNQFHQFSEQEEFTNFLHPEDAPHMKEIVVVETMEDIDKDKNGVISLNEYIGMVLFFKISISKETKLRKLQLK